MQHARIERCARTNTHSYAQTNDITLTLTHSRNHTQEKRTQITQKTLDQVAPGAASYQSCGPAQVGRGRCIEEACEKRLAVGRPGALAFARARHAPPRSMVARYGVLQCVAVWCSVVRYIAGWYSVVQCVPETLPCVCCDGLGTPTDLEGVLCQHCINAARAGLIFMCHFT